MFRVCVFFLTPFLLSGCVITMTNAKGNLQSQHVLDRIDEPRFVAGTEDVPVYPGLSPVKEGTVIYDTGAGRIIKAQYNSEKITPEKVKEFYTKALHQLGWKTSDAAHYARETEKMTLDILPQGNGVQVYFSIEPK